MLITMYGPDRNALYFSRNGRGRDPTVANPGANGRNNLQGYFSRAISPPPLKRQRTSTEHLTSLASRPNPRNSSRHDSSEDRRRYSAHNYALTSETSKFEHDSGSTTKFKSFPAPPTLRAHDHRSSNVSWRNSDVSPGSIRSSKRSCRSCEKTSNTTYNPIIVCLGCQRPYHDSCRKPPLIKGVDPQRWRCSICLASNCVRTTTHVTSISTTESSSTPATNSTRSSSIADVPYASEKVGTAKGTGCQRSAGPTTQATPDLSSLYEDERVCVADHVRSFELERKGRTEVPNTPTQRSSQVAVPDNAPNRHLARAMASSTNDSLFESSIPECVTSSMFVCPVCRTQHVLAKNKKDNAECRNCHGNSLTAGTRRLEIPETPDVVTRDAVAETSSQTANSKSLASASLPTSTSAPTPWLESDLVALSPTTRQISDVATPSSLTDPHKTLRLVDLPHGSDKSIKETRQEATHKPEKSRKRSADWELSDGNHSIGNEEDTLLKDSPDTWSTCLEESQTVAPWPLSHQMSSVRECTSAPVFPNEMVRAPPAVALVRESQPPTTPAFKGCLEYDALLADPETSLGSETTLSAIHTKRLTNRDLARIALANANSSRMTAKQIIDWLVQEFPHLRKGEGAWKKSLKSVLSTFPEFRGDKIAGDGVAKLYSFVDAQSRSQYVKEYQEYCKAPTSSSVQSNRPLSSDYIEISIPSIGHQNGPRRAIKSAPTQRSIAAEVAQPDLVLTAPPANHVVSAALDDKTTTPFRRTVPRQPRGLLSYSQGGKRTSSFYAFLQQSLKPPVDTITDEEKAKKVAEIRARPSRKAFFGSNHRLAHVRRYGRQDIHDESEGAWKPCFHEGTKPVNIGKDVDMGDGSDKKTLQEIFKLPAQAVPVNDGHMELAFRDATLINGRLPRSRRIYKVGKLFCGELTVRTS